MVGRAGVVRTLDEMAIRESADARAIEVHVTSKSWRGVVYRVHLTACTHEPVEEPITIP